MDRSKEQRQDLLPLNQNLLQIFKANKIDASFDGFTNFSENIRAAMGTIMVEVDSDKQVQKVVQLINKFNTDNDCQIKLRPAAGWKDKDKSECCSCFDFFKKAVNPEEKYNESFSFNEGVIGDVILRFKKKHHKVNVTKKNVKVIDEEKVDDNPIHALATHEIEVTAGTTVEELESYLSKHKYSVPTISMIIYPSLVGLVANACHGTGKDEPSLAGLVTEIKYVDHNGNIQISKKGDEGFDELIGANLGLAGIVLSMKLQVKDRFKLKEKVYTYASVDDLNKDLPELMQHQYFSTMVVPVYGVKAIEDELVSNIQVRVLDYTNEPVSHPSPVGQYNAESFSNELQVKVGESVQKLLFNSKLNNLIPYYMALTATIVTQTRGTHAEVDWANNIVHPIRSFPPELRDFSCLIPKADDEAPGFLARTLTFADKQFAKAVDDIPVTYALYVRYFKGTNGGMSTSSVDDDERTLAIEVVSHPMAPGFDALTKKLVEYFRNTEKVDLKYHLGKEIPANETFADFIGEKGVADFKRVLVSIYGDDEEALKNSIYMTPYFKSMLGYKLNKEEKISLEAQLRAKTHLEIDEMDDDHCIKELQKLIDVLNSLHPQGETEMVKKAIAAFITQCEHDLDELKESTMPNEI